MHPLSINKISDNVLTIKWSDDHESIYFADHLRKNCPCAACERERVECDDKPSKALKTQPGQIKISGWEMVGRYAVRFHFSDGHTTGIYLYQTLRDLCQCDLCDNDDIRIQNPLK